MGVCQYGRRIKIKLHDNFGRYEDGAILVCRAGYYDEPIQVPEEDEDLEFMGYGISISDAVLNGVPVHLGGVYFMDIAGFIPLEGENTQEEIDKLF